MKREETLAILRSQVELLRKQYGVKRLGVFGSIARDEATAESDVDIVVEMDPDLFAMTHLKTALEDTLHAPVDLVRYRQRMNLFLKQRIDKEAIYV